MTDSRVKPFSFPFSLSDLLIISFIVASLFFPLELAMAARRSGELVIFSVLPALFPFLVFGQMLISSGLCQKLAPFLGFLMPPLFALPQSSFSVLLLGLFAGFPVGATMTKGLYLEGALNKEQGERLIAFSNAPSFAFITGVVGGGILGDLKIGLLLYFASVAASLTLGVLLSFSCERRFSSAKKSYTSGAGIAKSLSHSVATSAHTSIEIAGFVVFFGVVIELLKQINFFSFLSLFGNSYTELATPIAYGFFEITNGAFAAAGLGNPGAALIILALILGFSSLSVIFQIASIVIPLGFSLKPLLIGKVLSAVLTVVFSGVFYRLPLFSNMVFASASSHVPILFSPKIGFLVLVVFTFVCTLIFALFRLTFTRK